jgi:hypothetical protein
MIVQSINEETKTVYTTWFSDSRECEEGEFPANSLDRANPPKTAAKKPAASAKAKPGRKPTVNNAVKKR